MNTEWVGIDFGTCNTSVARLSGDRSVMIPVRDAPTGGGVTQRPTVAYVTRDGEIKTGYAAEAYRFSDPERYFYKFKLDIHNRTPLLVGLDVTYQDLVSAILSDVWEDAKADNNNIAIDHAVITIPALYTEEDPRRNIMLSAARKAGFKTVELFFEPEAAALYYRHVSGEQVDDLTLIYDLGGGTFDPALIEKTEHGAKLLTSSAGKGLNCGGVTFDAAIFKWLRTNLAEVEVLFTGENKARVHELRILSQDLKHLLSTKDSASKPLPHTLGGEALLQRFEFEEMIAPLLDQTMACCTDLLHSCQKEWCDLSRVLLVGGSTHIPLIRKKISTYLETMGAASVLVTQTTIDKERRVDPICAVAAGAAVLKLKEKYTMDAELYESKRNELIELLDDVLSIEELRDETRDEVKAVQKKSLEDNFEIVLVGEFQGGKSTTFNAICDGREISPRGAMIKTSACKISACNLADPEIEEFSQITWKNERELLLGMIGLISPHLRVAHPERFGQATQEQMVQKVDVQDLLTDDRVLAGNREVQFLDLYNAKDLEIIRDCLAKEWVEYKKYPDSYGQDNIDVLYISSLVANFFDSEEIQALRNNSKMSVYDMGKLVTFPMDWTKRWQAGIAEAFKADEIAFAFIANVRCFIHSPNLARLGCVVTDCPGLFTSPWDTEVAHRAMLDADSILYLFGGSKTLDQGDIRALNEIRKVNMEHKLVYAVNVKGKLKHIAKNIVPENVAKLNAQGFDVSESDLHLYHALLGLCSRNGMPIKDGSQDKYSQNRFIEVAQTIDEEFSDDAEELWVELSDEMAANIARNESICALDEESIQKVAELSGLNDLFDGIEQTAIQKKAYAILVSQGAERASAALSLLEGDLLSREESAKKTEADFKVSVVKAREDLTSFQKESRSLINELGDPVGLIPMAEDFEQKAIVDNIDSMSEAICDMLAENVCCLSNILKLKSKKQMQAELSPVISDSINSVLSPAVAGWINKLEQGDLLTYESTLLKKSTDILVKLEERWAGMFDSVEANNLLSGLDLSIDFDVGNLNEKLQMTDTISNEALSENINRGKMMGVGSRLGGVLAGAIGYLIIVNIIGMITYSTLALIIGFWPTLIVTVGVALIPGVKLGRAATKKVQELFNKKLKKEITASMQNAFGQSDTRSLMREASLSLMNQIANLHLHYFKSALKKQNAFFDERIEKAKKDFEHSEKYRRELADMLSVLRTTKISPVKSEIDAFHVGILEVLRKSEGV